MISLLTPYNITVPILAAPVHLFPLNNHCFRVQHLAWGRWNRFLSNTQLLHRFHVSCLSHRLQGLENSLPVPVLIHFPGFPLLPLQRGDSALGCGARKGMMGYSVYLVLLWPFFRRHKGPIFLALNSRVLQLLSML